jgi:hypothetical protein
LFQTLRELKQVRLVDKQKLQRLEKGAESLMGRLVKTSLSLRVSVKRNLKKN